MAFTEQTGSNNPLNNVMVGNASVPLIADINGDDVPDLIVGALNGELYFYEQVDSIFSPRTGINNPFNSIDVGSNSTPTIGDVDGDGLLDILVGDNDGKQNFLKNIGTATNPEYEERTGTNNPFDGIDPGTFSGPSLVDLDGDGDLDLAIAKLGSSTLSYHENIGNSTSPNYTELTGTNNPFQNINVGDNIAPPSFIDLDDDDDLDLVVGQLDGTLKYFQNIGNSTSPSYSEQTGTANPFEGIDVGSYSAPTFADLDNDDDFDLVLGEESGTGLYYLNENIPAVLSSATEDLTETDAPLSASGTLTITDEDSPETFVAQTNTAGDYGSFSIDEAGAWSYFANSAHDELNTGETYTDSFTVTSADGTTTSVTININGTNDAAVIRSDDDILFSQALNTENPFDGFDVGFNSTPFFGDVDGDGDLDAVVGESNGTLNYFKNIGSMSNPIYSEQSITNNPFNGISTGDESTPALTDIDDDGDLDAFIGGKNGQLAYFENIGTATSPNYVSLLDTNPLEGEDVGDYSAPVFADIDGDGDVDALIGNEDGNLTYFENTSSGTSLSFTEQTGSNNPFDGLSAANNNATPTLADIDGDGDIDLLVGDKNGGLTYFKNLGTTTSPTYSEQIGTNNPFDGIGGNYSAPTFADLDGDGDLDAVVGDDDGTLKYFVNQTPSNPTVNLTETDTALTTSGKLNITDVDNEASFVAQANQAGDHGTFSIDTLGTWSYNTATANDSLANGETNTDTFTVAAADGTTTTVTINILGTNDAASISGNITGTATEAGVTAGVNATGDLNNTDVDNTDDVWNPISSGTASDNGFGTIEVLANGAWTYVIDENNTTVDNLNTGDSLVDTFTVTTEDGTSQTVNITIQGTDELAETSVELNSGNLAIADVNGGDSDDSLTLSESGGNFRVADASLNLGAGTGTTPFNNQTVDTALSSITGSITLDLLDGNDTVNALGIGQDLIVNGGESDDTVFGGNGNDSLSGENGRDRLLGHAGIDTLIGGEGNDYIRGGTGADSLDGGDGLDILDYVGSSAVIVSLDGSIPLSGGHAQGDIISNFERLFGSNYDDQLTGDDNTNLLFGRDGNDTISGAGGNDVIRGGVGADSLDGGDGIDVLDYSGSTSAVTGILNGSVSGGDAEGDTILNFERLYGSDYNDHLTGDTNSNLLLGREGDDTILGGDGNDIIRGGMGLDSLDGGEGIDVLDYARSTAAVIVSLDSNTAFGGNAEGDTILNFERLNGSDYDDRLTGDANANRLIGRNGDDRLLGGLGADVLVGGDGMDEFWLLNLNESLLTGRDRITDFAIGTDSLVGTSSNIDAAEIDQLGNVANLSEASLQTVLTTSVFEADTAATFTFGSRTFLAYNDNVDGFSASSDAVIEITGFSGDLSNLEISALPS